MDDTQVDQDTRTEAARVAAALRAVLQSDIDGLPDLPTGGRRTGAEVTAPRATAANETPAAVAASVTTPADADEDLILPDNLASLREVVAECTRCRLAASRSNTVFGEGPQNPILMVVGEGAGGVEDETGRPFAGEAGTLLTNILKAMGLDRERDCYITTVLKCRIPDDSTPTPEVIARCRPYVLRQIELIRPRFLLAMGQTAAGVLAGSPSITRLRGRFLNAGDTPLIVTYHPAALLKDPALKKLVWQDVQLIMERLKQKDSK